VPDRGRPAPPAERVAWLPPRAAKARKLILRGQLGLPWLLGAVTAALLILVAGGVLLAQGGRPGAPWVPVGPVDRFPSGAVVQTAGPAGAVLVVDRRGGLVRAFVAGPGRCQVVADGDGFARPCEGRRWDAEGRPSGVSGPALTRVPARVADGALYVDPGPR
jgi:hypothetical protein